uniref:Uncharacterized protein n=1 Tax=Myotis myotis TaxID=51298 RepID=A0A7J7VIW2_MYOMY|nr:hypothetical protein mMyoMyo1_008397 [Myotis myotis]
MTGRGSEPTILATPGLIAGAPGSVENLGDFLEFCLQLPKGKRVFQKEFLEPRQEATLRSGRWGLAPSSEKGLAAFLPWEKPQHVCLGVSTELGHTWPSHLLGIQLLFRWPTPLAWPYGQDGGDKGQSNVPAGPGGRDSCMDHPAQSGLCGDLWEEEQGGVRSVEGTGGWLWAQ